MIFDVTIDHSRSYSLHVSSIKDGIVGLCLVFDLLGESGVDFKASIGDEHCSDNGWAIEKTRHGFLLLFTCFTPMNGFRGGGTLYAYKSGNQPNLVDWPYVEFFELPKHCFLTGPTIAPVIRAICQAESPSRTAGFIYDPSYWETVS
jgi:hypothetical protein